MRVADHLLRPRAARAAGRSLTLAVTVAALTFCAIFGVIIIPLVGIAFGLAAGALAAVAIERSPRSREAQPVTT